MKNNEVKYFHYTYRMLEGDMQKLYQDVIQSGFDFQSIYGVARGGLIPATHLSYMSNKPLKVLNISFRDAKEQTSWDGDPDHLGNLQWSIGDGAKVLVVDDMSDSGKTFNHIYNELASRTTLRQVDEQVRFLSIWWNRASELKPHYYVREKNSKKENSWIIFPWEGRDTNGDKDVQMD